MLNPVERIRRFFKREAVYKRLKVIINFLLPDRSDIKFNLKVGGGSYTDGKQITVGVPESLRHLTDEELLVITEALTAHECQHDRSSDFKLFIEFQKEVSEYLKKARNILSGNGIKIAQHIFNSVEDGRIEKILSNRSKGLKKKIQFLNGSLWQVQPTDGSSELEDFLFSITSICVTGLYPKDYSKFYENTELDENIQLIKDDIFRGINAVSCKECFDVCWEVIKKVEPYLAKLLENKSREDENFLNQLPGKPEFTTSDEREYNSSRTVSTHFKPEPKPQSKQDESDENESQGQSSGEQSDTEEKETSSKSSKGSKKDKDESEKSEDEKSEKGSSQTNDKDSEETDSENDSKDSSGSENEDKDSEEDESKEGNSGDSDDSEDDENSEKEGSSKDGEEPDKQDSQDEKNSEDGKGQGSEDDSNDETDKKEEESNAEQPNSSDNSSADLNLDGQDPEFPSDDDLVKNQMREITDEVLEEAKENLKEKKSNKEKKEEGQKLSKDDVKEIDKQYSGQRTRGFQEIKGFPLNHQLTPVLKREGNKFRKEIERIFINKQSLTLKSQKRGIFDPNQAWKFAVKDYNLFTQKGTPMKSDYVAYVLADRSGSMCDDNKELHSTVALSTIEEGLKGVIPLKITAFTVQGEIIHYVIKDFDENDRSHNYSYNYYNHRRAGGGNKDGYSIRVATRELEKRPEKDKILIILSDGLPSDYNGGGKEGMEDVKQAVKEARNKGIFVVSMVFGSESFRDMSIDNYKFMYEKNIISCAPEAMRSHLTKLLTKIISR